MGKTVQELQEILVEKMKEVDAIQLEIEHAKTLEQVREKLDLMLEFVLSDDKLCKQISLLETEDCDDIGRKWTKSLGTLLKKALEGDVHEAPAVVAVTEGAPNVAEDTSASVTRERKPRKPRAKKESVSVEPKAEETNLVEQPVSQPVSVDGVTATAEEVVTDGSVTATESKETSVPVIPDVKPVRERKPSGSKMFNPARMMAEMKASNKKK